MTLWLAVLCLIACAGVSAAILVRVDWVLVSEHFWLAAAMSCAPPAIMVAALSLFGWGCTSGYIR